MNGREEGGRGAPCIRIGGMKDNFVFDTFLHFFGEKWHLSHQNTPLNDLGVTPMFIPMDKWELSFSLTS